jgi:ribonuclease Z
MQDFNVTILGCGSATPTASRNPTSQVIEVCGRLLLIDCGEGAQIQMRKFKVKFQKIDTIFISHLHGDHYLGLIGYLQSMHLLGRKNPLYLFGPAPLKEILDIQFKYSYTALNYELVFTATNTKQKELLFEDKCIEVHSFPLSHRIPTTGFLVKEKIKLLPIKKEALAEYKISVAAIQSIKEGGDYTTEDGTMIPNKLITMPPLPLRSYAYCSDTIYDERITEYIRGTDLLYHESTFLHDMLKRAKETFHTTALQAAQIAVLAQAKQLLLGHFSARYNDLSDFLTEAKPVFENTLLAEEGTTYSIK